MNVIIVGAAGRMGQEIARLCTSTRGLRLVAAIDPKGRGTHKNLAEVNPKGRGVLIDFSSPQGMREALAWSVRHRWNFVSGTTGISSKDQALLNKSAKKIAVLWASNMSVGIAVVKKLLKGLSALGEEFDFQIEDFHHRHKKDAPSGTAKTLQAELQRRVNKKLPAVLSVRGGGIFGVHQIWAMSDEEVVRIEHTALNRAVFAKGALKAAAYLAKKKKGLFTFDQVVDDN